MVPDRFVRAWDPVTVFFESARGPVGKGTGVPEDAPERFVTVTPAHPGAWTWLDAKTLQFKPAEMWPALARYAWTVDGRTTEVATLMTPPSATLPTDGAEGLGPVETITLTFGERLEPEALARMVSIELRPLPGVDAKAARWLVQETSYRVTVVPTPLQDVDGRSLELAGESVVPLWFPRREDYLRFVTGEGLVERFGPQLVPMEGRGQERVDLHIYAIDPLDRSFWPFPTNGVSVDESARPPGPRAQSCAFSPPRTASTSSAIPRPLAAGLPSPSKPASSRPSPSSSGTSMGSPSPSSTPPTPCGGRSRRGSTASPPGYRSRPSDRTRPALSCSDPSRSPSPSMSLRPVLASALLAILACSGGAPEEADVVTAPPLPVPTEPAAPAPALEEPLGDEQPPAGGWIQDEVIYDAEGKVYGCVGGGNWCGSSPALDPATRKPRP